MSKKVLIIDDDFTFQKTMKSRLEALSYVVESATDGEKGLEMAISGKPDLILLDIKMPKLEGIDLLKRLRENKDVPEMPVLITSNLSTIDHVSEGVTLGIKGYIIKSNETLDTIMREVDAILNPQTK